MHGAIIQADAFQPCLARAIALAAVVDCLVRLIQAYRDLRRTTAMAMQTLCVFLLSCSLLGAEDPVHRAAAEADGLPTMLC